MAIYRSPVMSPVMTAEDYFEWELRQELVELLLMQDGYLIRIR